MEHPDHLSSDEQSALLSASRAFHSIGTEEFKSWANRPFVEIIPVIPADPKNVSHEFRILTTRGEPGDPDYYQSPHGTISFKVFADGYNDAVKVSLNLMSPLYPKIWPYQ